MALITKRTPNCLTFVTDYIYLIIKRKSKSYCDDHKTVFTKNYFQKL